MKTENVMMNCFTESVFSGEKRKEKKRAVGTQCEQARFLYGPGLMWRNSSILERMLQISFKNIFKNYFRSLKRFKICLFEGLAGVMSL